MLHKQESNLWSIQEDDPISFRYISEKGLEYWSRRLTVVDFDPNIEPRPNEILISNCRECAYFQICHSYFKWPDNGYDCSGILTIFEALNNACLELKNDLAGT